MLEAGGGVAGLEENGGFREALLEGRTERGEGAIDALGREATAGEEVELQGVGQQTEDAEAEKAALELCGVVIGLRKDPNQDTTPLMSFSWVLIGCPERGLIDS
ncbi:hypothetical protein WDZ92_27385 [Nostoc sp. NIES-2111]